MTLIVNAKDKTLTAGGVSYPCRIGRAGFTDQAKGREGDWKTPLGTYAIRYGFYRSDRLPRSLSGLTFHALKPDDGWCDAPGDIAYNMPVRLPYPASAEVMWKADGVYDIVIVLGHNDSPPEQNLGSAIFLHVAHIDDRATAGCIAVTPCIMTAILPALSLGMQIIIRA